MSQSIDPYINTVRYSKEFDLIYKVLFLHGRIMYRIEPLIIRKKHKITLTYFNKYRIRDDEEVHYWNSPLHKLLDSL
jgi:hypothetical protein